MGLYSKSVEGLTELRHEVHKAEENQVALQERKCNESRDYIQQETDTLRSEVRASVYTLQSNVTCFDEHMSKYSKQLDDITKQRAEDMTRLDERLSAFTKEHDAEWATALAEPCMEVKALRSALI